MPRERRESNHRKESRLFAPHDATLARRSVIEPCEVKKPVTKKVGHFVEQSKPAFSRLLFRAGHGNRDVTQVRATGA